MIRFAQTPVSFRQRPSHPCCQTDSDCSLLSCSAETCQWTSTSGSLCSRTTHWPTESVRHCLLNYTFVRLSIFLSFISRKKKSF